MTDKKHDLSIDRQSLSSQLHDVEISALQRYRQKAAGQLSNLQLLRYELANLFFADLGGGLGYLFRKWSYGGLFKEMGAGTIIGKGFVVRHPGSIRLGRQVAIDDYVLLDASGAGDQGVELGDRVIISRHCIIQGKSGPIAIGSGTDIGANTLITSASGVHLESSVLIAGNCYIGGSRYVIERLDVPILEQGWYSRGCVRIGMGSWLGAGVIVLDGVHIGRGCVIGAGSVVTQNLPDYSIALGTPARVVKSRDDKGTLSNAASADP